MKGFPDLPPVWALGFAFGEWLLARELPIVAFGSRLTELVGSILVLIGFGTIVWAALWFRRKATAIEPNETPTALIVEGPYRINRNPIYSGMTIGLVGLGLCFGAVSSLVLALLFPALITWRFVRREEAVLRRVFGPEADRYLSRTRRW